MNQVLYVTTNDDKFDRAKINLRQFDIELIHERFEMTELQSSNGEEIVSNKAQQAFEYFKKPVLVNDDTWSIPVLRGFPSTGMKLCNEFLIAEDWLRLMQGIEDRRVFLLSYYAFHDGKTIKTTLVKEERYFLNRVQGENPKAPFLEVIAKAGSNRSIAEEIATGRKVDKENLNFWKELAEILQT